MSKPVSCPSTLTRRPARALPLALSLTLAALAGAGAQTSPAASQPHPQPGSIWTVILNGQVMTYRAQETDGEGDSTGTLTAGGRQMKAFVIHSPQQLRLLVVDEGARWACDVPAAGLSPSTREMGGQALAHLSTPKLTHGAGACRLYTSDRLPARRTLAWNALEGIGEWEIDTPEGTVAVRARGQNAFGLWGRGGVAALGDASADGQVIMAADAGSFTLSLLQKSTRNLYRLCTADPEGLTDGTFITGRYVDGADANKMYGQCVMRPAGSTVVQAVSVMPSWPVPLAQGQLWEMQLPEGTFRGVLGQLSQDKSAYLGGWFGPFTGLLTVLKVDAGTSKERVGFFLDRDNGEKLICVVEESRNMGLFRLEQFGSADMQLTNRIHGSALRRQKGQDSEDHGECWVRPLVSGLLAGGLK